MLCEAHLHMYMYMYMYMYMTLVDMHKGRATRVPSLTMRPSSCKNMYMMLHTLVGCLVS